MQIDHDQLFKELLSTFFVEFIELFLPEVASYLEREPIIFLQQEYFNDLITGERKIIDLLALVKFRGQQTCFIIHVENQSYTESDECAKNVFLFCQATSRIFATCLPSRGVFL